VSELGGLEATRITTYTYIQSFLRVILPVWSCIYASAAYDPMGDALPGYPKLGMTEARFVVVDRLGYPYELNALRFGSSVPAKEKCPPRSSPPLEALVNNNNTPFYQEPHKFPEMEASAFRPLIHTAYHLSPGVKEAQPVVSFKDVSGHAFTMCLRHCHEDEECPQTRLLVYKDIPGVTSPLFGSANPIHPSSWCFSVCHLVIPTQT